MLTIREILDSTEFSYLSLLNSPTDLDREIHAIDTTETPDVANFLPNHTFLLTTGMAFQNEPEKFCAFISSLNELPVAGIGIKLGRYLGEIDPMVIAHADDLNFPLIQVSKEQTLWSVSQQLVSHLWDSQAGEMQMALNIQRQFSQMMLKGSSIDNLVKYLGSILNIPIVLEDPFFNIITTSQHYNTSKFSIGQFKEDHERILDKKIQTYLKSQSKRAFENNEYYIHPITIEPLLTYYLTFKKKNIQSFPLSSLMLEQISFILSHTIYKELKLKEEYMNAKKPFFNRLLNKDHNFLDRTVNWVEYGSEYHLVQSDYYRIAIAHFYSDKIPFTNIEAKRIRLALIYSWVEKQLAAIDNSIVLFPMDNLESFGILFQAKPDSFKAVLEQLNALLQKTSPFQFQFHIGNPVLNLSDVHFSFKEALEIAKTENSEVENPLITYYETKRTQDLFHNIPDHVKRDFCLATLKELAYPTDESLIELRETLKVYLDTQCNIQLSSKRLFVHRNTVIYRINKCKELIGITLKDPQETLNLRVAFEMTE